MILIISNERDITADYVVLELVRRGQNVFRLNTETLPTREVTYQPSNGIDAWTLSVEEECLDLRDVSSVYYRRPGAPSVPWVADPGLRRYCETEWASCLKSLLAALEGRFLNSPMNIMSAEDKPRQLALAHSIGFGVPRTYIGNDPRMIMNRDSVESWVVKPIREPIIEFEGDEFVAFTSEVLSTEEIASEDIRVAPFILQHKVEKKVDVRVTVVGNEIFATEIHSQEFFDTKVDWRYGSRCDLHHSVHSLPVDIEEKCFRLLKRLGLRYGAIDLVLDEDHQYWFLEINPNGQWAWLENRTGVPITAAICDSLMEIGNSR